MSDIPYQVLGVDVPSMLGRERLFEELCRHLSKSNPDHVSVIGPALFGKSVLLNHLATQFARPSEHFSTSLYWDLRHGTPVTDDEFRRRFTEHIKIVLQKVEPEFADYLDLEGEDLHDLLHLVFSEMQTGGVRILAVLDGFDRLLAEGRITRNLWDNLRTLCQMSSLRVVTGSRSRLRELCKTEESRTSDFWEIFYDTPLHVGCFEEHDWDGFLKPFESRGVELDGSARKEFANWTGGVPTLSAALAERLLLEAPEEASLSKPHVDDVAMTTLEERHGLLDALWDGCDVEIRSDLAELANRDVPQSEIPDGRMRVLKQRGFAVSSGRKLRSSCRFMRQYAQEQASEVENLKRLFGDAKRFNDNIRDLLQLRVDQVSGSDPIFLGYVKKAIRDLHPEPTQSTTWARSIANHALDLIWEAELPSSESIPQEWKFVGVKFDVLPQRRGQQCSILRLITGTEDNVPVASFVTKPTYLLADHIQSVGDFGQHRQGITVSTSFAASFCLSAIALCESLARDLAAPSDAATVEDEEPNKGP